jgi:glycosyltransferase involved in cell wall biosynthesis
MSAYVYLCQVFQPDNSATSQLFSPLIRDLSEIEPITVYCGFPSQGISDLKRMTRNEQHGRLTIRRLGLRVAYKRNRLSHLLGHLTFVLHAFFMLCLLPRKSIVTATTNPPFNLHILYLASLVKRFTYRMIILDIYPEGLVATGILHSKNPLTCLWKYANGRGLRKAQRVAVIGRDMRDLLRKNYRLSDRSLTYFPHWSALEPDNPVCTVNHPLLLKWGLSDCFVVQYSGNMGLWHDMNHLVDIAASLSNSGEDNGIHFLFIGRGRARKDAVYRASGLANVTFHDFLPTDDLPLSLTACHVSLISMKNGLTGVAVPCKIYGIMASARAVLAMVPAKSEIAYTVLEHRIGYVVEPGDVDRAVQLIGEMKENPEETIAMGQRAFKAYHRYYSRSVARKNLERFIIDPIAKEQV